MFLITEYLCMYTHTQYRDLLSRIKSFKKP